MDPWTFRSAVLSRNAAVSSDQPLANNVGLDILKLGGNAADAAIAMSAVVSLLQPMTSGIGGDVNCIFYRKSDENILSINGSGRTGKNATIEKLVEAGILSEKDVQDSNSGLWISIPGAVAALFDIYENFGSGKLSMGELLAPAIRIAEEGFSLPYKSSLIWRSDKILNSRNAKNFLNENGELPRPGDVMYAPELSDSFRMLIANGPEAFYKGDIANAIIDEVQYSGGVLTLDDLKFHLANTNDRHPTAPLSVNFHGFRMWEMKPNTIGVVALVAVNILKGINLKELGHNSAEYIHVVAEALKLAFIECWDFLADPRFISGSLYDLLSEDTAMKLRSKIYMTKVINTDKIVSGGDTSYLAAVDQDGNGCSFIFSISSHFGSGQFPKGCGFVLHDRAKLMSLDRNSPNAYGPNKLPLHTIIPGMLTNAETGELEAVFGVQGRWMQPQGQIQVLLNMVIFGMDPQNALNQPRFTIGAIRVLAEEKYTLNQLHLEQGINPGVIPILKGKGHDVSDELLSGEKREILGKGHIIARQTVWNCNASNPQKVWWSGSDPRCDGASAGF